MLLDIIKDMWDYTTYNKPFLLLIMGLFFLFCLFIQIFEDMKVPYALYLSMIPYIFIAGYGMTITKDAIHNGKRLPKILIKDVIVLGIKSTVVFIVYLTVQGMLFSLVASLFNFPVVDVEWIKINGKWKYRHTLLDAISNCIVTDAIYDTEDETTVKKFLSESTMNKNKIAITTDLDPKYSSIISKLGFKLNYAFSILKKV